MSQTCKYAIFDRIFEISTSWIKAGGKGDTAIKLSSGEAETAGAAEGLKVCKHLHYLAQEMKIKATERINMRVDATVAIAFANNVQCNSKMKQINLCWGWVQELRDQGTVRLVKVSGLENKSDCLTKVLTGPEFMKAEAQLKQIRE